MAYKGMVVGEPGNQTHSTDRYTLACQPATLCTLACHQLHPAPRHASYTLHHGMPAGIVTKGHSLQRPCAMPLTIAMLRQLKS